MAPPSSSFYHFIFIFFIFWLCWVFIAAQGFPLVVESGGSSRIAAHGLLIVVLLLFWITGSRYVGSVVAACGLSSRVVVAHWA